MTNKESIEELKPLTKYSIDKNGVVGTFPMVWRPEQVEALNLAIKALEEVECLPENLHREREQAYMNGYADGYKRGEEEQERPTGEWIIKAEDYYKAINERGGGVDENTPYFVDDIACPKCLTKFSTIDNETERFNCCPNCGAKMKQEAEDE